MSKDPSFQVDLIREAFHYRSRFDGATMVFKIDFPVTQSPAFPYLMQDMALLAQTGFRVVIVPGAKERIDEILLQYGMVSGYRGLTRITTKSALPFVEMAAFDVATRFITGLSGNRVDAVIGNFVRARGLGVLEGLDMESTGTVDRIFTPSMEQILERKMVPILPCIGWSAAGKPYNVLSDEIALSASAALGALKLFIISAPGGFPADQYRIPQPIHRGKTGRIVQLSPPEAAAILEANPGKDLQERPLQELRLALQASKAGVERVHIIDGSEEGAILRELFSNLGAGTMVYGDEYEAIRPLEPGDIPGILRLMEPLVQQGNLVRRTAEQIQGKQEDYVALMIDGSLHACGALHDWGESQGEIAAIATDPGYTDLGLGRRIVHYLIDRAMKTGLRRVFVLTTRTQDWFEALGFQESSVESLPERRRNQYDHSRRSKIFALELSRFPGEAFT